MKRTISGMVGKGSINHNERKFLAENVDGTRTKDNVILVNEDIKAVYHELFDDALERYNAKQTRKDRKIEDYYEHIRQGKQENLFHEVIFQIGNKDDMAVGTEEGILAKEMLCEFMQNFQKRNPNLKVFSAHIHMDEATPHLHIDFVPFTTESKRGLDTRVSLKKALESRGFKSKAKSDTEWNQWIESEKMEVAKVMERHGIEWEKKDTHREHLSVLDFKKEERTKEVEILDEKIQDMTDAVQDYAEQIEQNCAAVGESEKEKRKAELAEKKAVEKKEKAERQLKQIAPYVNNVKAYAIEFCRPPEELLPEATKFETGKNYREKKAMRVVRKIRDVVVSLYSKFYDLEKKYEQLKSRYASQSDTIQRYRGQVNYLEEKYQDLEYLKNAIGPDRAEDMIARAKYMEQQAIAERKMHKKKSRGYEL